MTRSAAITEDWADGRYTFRLAIAQLEELDENCGVGPGFALGLVQAGISGNWKAKMIREVIRLGLIGGGMTPPAAFKLVTRYVDDRPLFENLTLCKLILSAAVVGVTDDAPGEPRGEGTTESLSPTDGSGSPISTGPEGLADFLRAKSAKARSGKSPRTSRAGASPTARTTAKA